jgi:hypothetical protein
MLMAGTLIGMPAFTAARNLTLSGHENLSHDHVLDFGAGDSRALEGRLDGDGTEVGGGERSKSSTHLADRGAGSGDDV